MDILGYTGGFNLADEYINVKQRFGVWKDTGVKINGPAVKNMTIMFLQMWNVTGNEKRKNIRITYFLITTPMSLDMIEKAMYYLMGISIG